MLKVVLIMAIEAGIWSIWAATKNILDVVMMMPFTPPKVDIDTNNGMIHHIKLKLSRPMRLTKNG